MGDSKIQALTFLMLMWITITIMANYFEQDIILSDVTDLKPNDDIILETSLASKLFKTLDTIPIINYFSPLFKIMSFQYTDNVPPALSIFLILFSVVSAYLVYTMIRGY